MKKTVPVKANHRDGFFVNAQAKLGWTAAFAAGTGGGISSSKVLPYQAQIVRTGAHRKP
jgi:hypothetical protein